MPSLGARMANELGFRASVDHLPVSQWGCSGGVASLKWADIYCRANPRAAVLVLCVEVCSAMWHAELDRGSLVCAALFGDAAGGVVVMGPDCPLLQRGPQRVGMTLAATREHLIPNSSHWMYYDVDAKGLHFRLSKAVSESMNVAAPVIAEFAKVTKKKKNELNVSVCTCVCETQRLTGLLPLPSHTTGARPGHL